MLGSRFDLKTKLEEFSARRAAEAPVGLDAPLEASCVELEREMAALALSTRNSAPQPASTVRVTFRCPVCDDTMRLGEESESTEFHGLDVKLHRLQCDNCGMLAGRVYHPAAGYDPRLVR